MHELATNAGKDGALSDERGCVDVHWRTFNRDGARWLELRWTEHDGPEVTPPSRRGFGSRLISEGVSYELGGTVTLDFPVTGVTCTIAIPLPESRTER